MREVLCISVCSLFIAIGVCADKTAAVVNGEVITVAELDATLTQLPDAKKRATPVEIKQLRRDALQLLADDRLIRQFLKQNGPKIDDAEVEKQFAALVAGQKQMGKTVDQYLKEIDLSQAQIKENFRLMLQLDRYLEAQGTDERLRKYYDLTRDAFDGTTVRLSQIVIRASSSFTNQERQKAITKLRGIRTDILAGKLDFATAAKKHSECDRAARGGDLGFVARKFHIEEPLARAAFAMKPNELSDVIECEEGFCLILVVERKQGKPSRYENALRDVRECFETDLKQALLTDLRKKARIEILIKD